MTSGCSGNECSVGLTLVTTTARLLVISGSFLAGGQGAGPKARFIASDQVFPIFAYLPATYLCSTVKSCASGRFRVR